MRWSSAYSFFLYSSTHSPYKMQDYANLGRCNERLHFMRFPPCTSYHLCVALPLPGLFNIPVRGYCLAC